MLYNKKSMKKTTSKPTKEANKKTKLAIIPNTVIKITIPKKEAQQAYNKAVNKLAKYLKIDGFRKGKIPTKIAKKHLNQEKVIEEALQKIVPSIYIQEVKKAKLKPLVNPEFKPVSLKLDQDWILEAHIAQKPDIKLTKYKKIVKQAQKKVKKRVEQTTKKLEKTKKLDKQQVENIILETIYKELVEELKPEIQELLVKQEVSYDLDNLAKQLKQMNIPFEKFLNQRKITFQQLSEEMTIVALARLQISFIINAIAVEEKIKVTKTDLDKELKKINNLEVRKQQENNPRYIDMLHQTIIHQKVKQILLDLK